MTTSSNKGGGFSIGMIYGLITSIMLYLVLCFLFPLDLGTPVLASAPAEVAAEVVQEEGNAPVVASVAPTAQPELPDTNAPVVVPEVEMATMVQPDIGQSEQISIGGAGDSGPATLVTQQIAGSEAEAEPELETQSTGTPDIGNGSLVAATPATSEVPVTNITAGEQASNQPSEQPAELASTPSGPAIEVFSIGFQADPLKPMLAIILEDTLETSLEPLFLTGKPLNFALSAEFDSSISAQSIRESGYEVVAMVPSGTSRTEGVAENIERFMQNVPVAVALLDASTSGVMLNRDAMLQVLETTRPAGLGIITFAGSGDIVARDQALRFGAPYGNVVQTIDQTADIELIIQALDRAAFDALTKGSSIVFARTKPATIEAITRWLNGAYAQRLQIVPVSVAINTLVID